MTAYSGGGSSGGLMARGSIANGSGDANDGGSNSRQRWQQCNGCAVTLVVIT